MGAGSFPIDLILFGMIAAFLVLRLRSILGKRTGFEQQSPPPMPQAPVRQQAPPVIDGRAEPAPQAAPPEDAARIHPTSCAPPPSPEHRPHPGTPRSTNSPPNVKSRARPDPAPPTNR